MMMIMTIFLSTIPLLYFFYNAFNSFYRVPQKKSWFSGKSAVRGGSSQDENHQKRPRKTLLKKINLISIYKYTNTICSNTQIHFEIRRKYSLNLGEKLKKIQQKLKRCLQRREQGTVELIKNY